jgi:hypothetical protein
MSREHDSGSRGRQPTGSDAGQAAQNDPRMMQVQQLVQAARVYNRQHPDKAAEFSKLTGIDPANFRAVRAWQLAHGQRGDGRIGSATLKAAQAEKEPAEKQQESGGDGGTGSEGNPSATKEVGQEGGQPKHASNTVAKRGHSKEAKTITFGQDEGSTVEGDNDTSVGGEILENPTLMDNILDGAGHLGKTESDPSETLIRTGDAANQVNDANKVREVVEGGEGKDVPWLKAVMAPAIIDLIRQGRYSDAAITLAKQFSPSDCFEAILYATEKLGIEVGRPALKWLVEYGAEADVIFALGDWTYEGLNLIAEAHEKGDAKSRIRMYARAFADGFLNGNKADGGRAGAATAEQKEAVEFGIRDGSRTVGSYGAAAPAIAKELLRRFGGDDGRVKHAIMDGLMKRAGLPGVWS